MHSVNKTPSYNQTGLVKYEWHNVKYHDNCKQVMMAPDMDLLPDIINNLWENCDKPEPTMTELFFDKIDRTTSPNFVYASWLTDALERCKGKC